MGGNHLAYLVVSSSELRAHPTRTLEATIFNMVFFTGGSSSFLFSRVMSGSLECLCLQYSVKACLFRILFSFSSSHVF